VTDQAGQTKPGLFICLSNYLILFTQVCVAVNARLNE
jgi:hypothetical protein